MENSMDRFDPLNGKDKDTPDLEPESLGPDGPSDAVWHFRGYQLRPSEFITAMVHYFRAEVQRSNTWRTRLDATTNWAVIAAGAALSFALSSPNNHYGVIILDTLLITLFLWIEARRYRYYELWSYRARLVETDLFAAMLVPPFKPQPGWAESLAESLLQPEFPISMWEAFGRRLRRNYLWIFMILAFAWALKSFLHPFPATSWTEFLSRSSLGPLPGSAMVIAGLIYNGILFLIAALTASLHNASGEVLPKYEDSLLLARLRSVMDESQTQEHTFFSPRLRRRKQLVTLIITDHSQAIADKVMKVLRRGVTGLNGQGMYTHKEHQVLLVALSVTEVAQLKALVREEDPNAFMIVTPAQEVLGRGVQPLSQREDAYQSV
jgi:uncharacterized membrane protein